MFSHVYLLKPFSRSARKGVVAYGCDNGSYGLLEVKKQDALYLQPVNKPNWTAPDSISGLDIKDEYLILGTVKGRLLRQNIHQKDNMTMLVDNDTPIRCVHA